MNNDALTKMMTAWLRDVMRQDGMEFPIELVCNDSAGWLYGIRCEEDGATEVSCQSWDRPLCLRWPLTLRVFDRSARTRTLILSKDCDSHCKTPKEAYEYSA